MVVVMGLIRAAFRDGAFILFPVASGQPAVYFTVSAATSFVAEKDKKEIKQIIAAAAEAP